jgi:hypothetical protein
MSSHNINFWWLTFIFRYASDEIKTQKSRERSAGSLKGTLLRCLRIELLKKDRETQVKMRIVCGMRCRLTFKNVVI